MNVRSNDMCNVFDAMALAMGRIDIWNIKLT